MTTCVFRRRWLLTVLLAALPTVAWAQAAVVRLAEDAPEDTALFLELPALEANWSDLERSELRRRWEASALFPLWHKSRFAERWRALDEQAAERSGRTLTQHLRTLFADGVAVAVVLRGPEPTGLLIARARSAEDVTAVLAAWDRLEPPLKIESRAEPGAAYFARVVRKSGGEQTTYYAVDGVRFALSDRELLVRECAARWRNPSAAGRTLAEEPEYQELLAADEPLARLFVSVRRWRPQLAALSDGTPPAELMLAGISALRSVEGTVNHRRGIVLQVTARLESHAQTDGWRAFQQTADRWPTLLSQTPPEALLAVGSRASVRPLLTGLVRLMPERDRDEWDRGRRILRALLQDVEPWTQAAPALFADWGAFAVPAASREGLPFVGLWRSELSGPEWTEALQRGSENALSFGLNLLTVTLSAQEAQPPVSLRSESVASGRQWRLSGRRWGDLFVRLTPEALEVTNATAGLSPRSAIADEASPLVQTAREEFPQAAVFAWCHTARLRSPDGLPALLAMTGPRGLGPLAAVGEVSGIFDQLFAATTFHPDRIELRLGGRVTSER